MFRQQALWWGLVLWIAQTPVFSQEPIWSPGSAVDLPNKEVQIAPPAVPRTAHDGRQLVQLEVAVEWLSMVSMRDYLMTLMRITEQLARDELDTAARLAEERLGLTAAESVLITRVLEQAPEEFRSLTEDLHQTGTRLATLIRSDDRDGALDAMADVMQVCVTCHAQYRYR